MFQNNKFSYSSLSLFEECPFCFYLKYVCGIRQEMVSSNLLIGSIIHSYFEQEHKTTIDVNKLIEEKTQGITKIKGLTLPEIKQECHRLISTIRANPLSLKIAEHELEFYIPFGESVLHGRIDAITDQEELIEHKTSRIKYNMGIITQSYQYRIYALAYKHLKGRLPRKIIYDVIYKAKNPIRELIPVNVTEQDVIRARDWASGLIKMIREEKFIPSRSIGKLHKGWCDYSNLCQYCQK